eukprot:64483-Chlamydomonas_euryale.AAC.4
MHAALPGRRAGCVPRHRGGRRGSARGARGAAAHRRRVALWRPARTAAGRGGVGRQRAAAQCKPRAERGGAQGRVGGAAH